MSKIDKRQAAEKSAGLSGDPKEKALHAMLGQIERQYGKGSVMRMGDVQAEKIDSISTGSIATKFLILFKNGFIEKLKFSPL